MFLCDVMNPRAYQDCFNSALRLLARRDHSRLELSQKLKQRGFGKDQIQATIEECCRFNYVDDEKFAEIYTQQLQRRGFGPRRIRQMLITKGIPQQLIADTFQKSCLESKEREDCRVVLTKKLKAISREQNEGIPRARLYRFLSNRGFSSPIIRRALDDIIS